MQQTNRSIIGTNASSASTERRPVLAPPDKLIAAIFETSLGGTIPQQADSRRTPEFRTKMRVVRIPLF
jgi:hypothetical protein